jgi:tRNA pseudouridine38-40 synthase
MRNIRLTLAYDGSHYVGWQVQPNGTSVESVVTSAIEKLTGESVKLIGAGRTDSGVHALGQVANFHTVSTIGCEKFRRGLESHLPDDVTVRAVEDVAPDFHARYAAKRKEYRYVIHNSRIGIPFLRRYAYRFGAALDADRMHAAAQVLVGTHDFRSFESHFPNRATSVRTVSRLEVRRHDACPIGAQPDAVVPVPVIDGEFIWIDVAADGFLYNMVRAIVGTLLYVGRGKWSAADVERIRNEGDRSQAGETAPPHGLYLVNVDYMECMS